jgi:hypothetical protein
MVDDQENRSWESRLIQPGLPWKKDPIRPAEVNNGLLAAMVDRTNTLEDARYQKIVPNQYIIELSEGNYARNYKPIEVDILRQWKDSLLERLMLANSRQGRKEYRFAGRLQLTIRAVDDLKDSQARILCQVASDDSSGHSPQGNITACLKWIDGERQWDLLSDIVTIGRDAQCSVYLDMPMVQDRRLVSGVHANLRYETGGYRIYDGEPGGKPSLNGTYVNGKAVSADGHKLQDGDIIILASIDPTDPRMDTPGAAVLRFHFTC